VAVKKYGDVMGGSTTYPTFYSHYEMSWFATKRRKVVIYGTKTRQLPSPEHNAREIITCNTIFPYLN
jgi:hypothetical protein